MRERLQKVSASKKTLKMWWKILLQEELLGWCFHKIFRKYLDMMTELTFFSGKAVYFFDGLRTNISSFQDRDKCMVIDISTQKKNVSKWNKSLKASFILLKSLQKAETLSDWDTKSLEKTIKC